MWSCVLLPTPRWLGLHGRFYLFSYTLLLILQTELWHAINYRAINYRVRANWPYSIVLVWTFTQSINFTSVMIAIVTYVSRFMSYNYNYVSFSCSLICRGYTEESNRCLKRNRFYGKNTETGPSLFTEHNLNMPPILWRIGACILKAIHYSCIASRRLLRNADTVFTIHTHAVLTNSCL